jgi:hypothetical protein
MERAQRILSSRSGSRAVLGTGGHGNSVAHGVEDFDGVPFGSIGRDVAIDGPDDIAPFKPMLWHIALQDGVGIEF